MNTINARVQASGLRVESLSFGYDYNTPVIEQCSLQVPPGSVHCVLGSSGGGKTTLLRLIAGLERADGGTIWIDAEQVAGHGVHLPPERRPVGMVFQDLALFPNRSVRRNVLFGVSGGSRANRIERANALLDLVGIRHLSDRMPHTLSGGQQQRVAIARALTREPKVMLLDEPFSSLDRETRVEVRTEIINLLRQQGVATLMVTHDPSEADAIADTVSRVEHRNMVPGADQGGP